MTAGKSVVAIHGWTFLLGPGWVVGVGNGPILGWLMYRSGLVSRGMALLGLVAGPVLLAGGTAALLGVIEPDSTLKNLDAAPSSSGSCRSASTSWSRASSPPGWPGSRPTTEWCRHPRRSQLPSRAGPVPQPPRPRALKTS